jgi:large subunit ribosomal protein L23
MERVFDLIKKPVVTEKSTIIGEKQNAYVFHVQKDATKTEIRNAIEKLFSVKVKDVNTMVVHGKVKRVGRHVGRRPNWKKAIVTLYEDQQINLFEGV